MRRMSPRESVWRDCCAVPAWCTPWGWGGGGKHDKYAAVEVKAAKLRETGTPSDTAGTDPKLCESSATARAVRPPCRHAPHTPLPCVFDCNDQQFSRGMHLLVIPTLQCTALHGGGGGFALVLPGNFLTTIFPLPNRPPLVKGPYLHTAQCPAPVCRKAQALRHARFQRRHCPAPSAQRTLGRPPPPPHGIAHRAPGAACTPHLATAPQGTGAGGGVGVARKGQRYGSRYGPGRRIGRTSLCPSYPCQGGLR